MELRQDVAPLLSKSIPQKRERVPQCKLWTIPQEDLSLAKLDLQKNQLSVAQRDALEKIQSRLEYLARNYFIWPQSLQNSPPSSLASSLEDTAKDKPLSTAKIEAKNSDSEIVLPKKLQNAIADFTLGQAMRVCNGGHATEQFSFASSLDITSSMFDSFWATGLLLPELNPGFISFTLFTPIAAGIFLGLALPLGIVIAAWHYWIERREDDKYAALLFYQYLYFNQVLRQINRKKEKEKEFEKRAKREKKRWRTYDIQKRADDLLKLKKTNSLESRFQGVISPCPSDGNMSSSTLLSGSTIFPQEEEQPAAGGDLLPSSVRKYWKKSLISSITLGLFSYAAMYGMLWALGSIDAFNVRFLLMKVSPFLLSNWFIIAVGVSFFYAAITGFYYYRKVQCNLKTQEQIKSGYERIERHKRILLKANLEPVIEDKNEVIPKVTSDLSLTTKVVNFVERALSISLGLYFFYWALNAIFPPSVIFAPAFAIPIFFISFVIGLVVAYVVSSDDEHYPERCDRMIHKNKIERKRYHNLLDALSATVYERLDISCPVQLPDEATLEDEKQLIDDILGQQIFKRKNVGSQFAKKIEKFKTIANEGARVQIKASHNFKGDKSLSTAIISGFVTFVLILDFYWCATEIQGLMLSALLTTSPASLFIFIAVLAAALILSSCIAYHSYQASRIRLDAQLKLIDLHAENASLLEQVHGTIKIIRSITWDDSLAIPRASSLDPSELYGSNEAIPPFNSGLDNRNTVSTPDLCRQNSVPCSLIPQALDVKQSIHRGHSLIVAPTSTTLIAPTCAAPTIGFISTPDTPVRIQNGNRHKLESLLLPAAHTSPELDAFSEASEIDVVINALKPLASNARSSSVSTPILPPPASQGSKFGPLYLSSQRNGLNPAISEGVPRAGSWLGATRSESLSDHSAVPQINSAPQSGFSNCPEA